MALPSRPNARVGLPTNPAPRSRSLVRRPPREDLPRPESSATEFIPWRPAPSPPAASPPVTPLRLHRSTTDIRSGQSRSRSVDSRRSNRPSSPPPPLPLAPIPRRAEWDPAVRNLEQSTQEYVAPRKRSDGSVSSWGSSSSGSSLSQDSLRSYGSFASSRTSVADDVPPVPKIGGDDREAVGAGALSSPDSAGSQSPDRSRPALWARVANAAGNLKVNVSKALGASLTSDAAEASTPVGQESRLTRAMKAYHVEKARDANDLPDWLFEGRDRDVILRLRGNPVVTAEQQAEAIAARQASPSPAPNRRREPSLPRSNTSSPSSWRPQHSRASSASSVYVQSVHATTPSRDAMNRLKELRLAKRNARVRFADDDDDDDDDGKATRGIQRPPTPGAVEPARTSTVDTSPVPVAPSVPRRMPTMRRQPSRDERAPSRVGLPTSVRPQRL